MTQRSDLPPPRFSVSHLPADVEPAEKDFARMLERALAPSFALVKRIGAGGMGSVYLARDPVLKRLVAVKVMAPSLAADPEARARFEREAQAVASISHPNVVSVYSVGELENGVPYLVMQYVEGRTMSERLKEDGPFEARAAKRVLGEVASALAAAHRKGVIHRDIKPANILWDDETGRALVTDFGIAAVLDRGDAERDATKITHTGMAIGTPAYMSPEQLLAEPVTEKTDIYSLGLLGYELFIGEGPYQISSPRELMAAHLRDTPRKLSKMRGDVDPELERLLEECLIKDPLKRPTAAQVESRLMHGASVLLEWPPPGLETAGATLRNALRVLLIGALAAGTPLALLSLFDRESVVRQTLPPMLFMLALTGIGLLVFCVGLVALWRFFRALRPAVAAGYGWRIMLEAASDIRGDTGALIAGGREYAELSPATRSTMRRSRVLATYLRIIAGLAPVLGWAIGVFVAARWRNGPTVVLWSSILLSLTLLAAAYVIHRQEERAMGPARRRMRTATARSGAATKLAETWMASFEQVRIGQPMGAGSNRYGRPARYALAATLVLSALVGITVLVVMLLATSIGVATQDAIPTLSTTRAKIARSQRLTVYRVPIDTTITPLRAGQALHAITSNGPRDRLLKFERAPAITIPTQRRSWPENDGFGATPGGWRVAAFRQAPRGFTAPQRDFLKAVADNTAMEEFRILARAAEYDLPATMWDLSSARWYELPVPKFGPLRQAASANAAQAALDLAAGRTQDAERRLREILSVGFLMIRDGRVLLENLIGASIVQNGRASLAAFYEVTGRVRDTRIFSEEADPVVTVIERMKGQAMTPDEQSRQIRRIILDDTEMPGLRWEMLTVAFSLEPCADMHQIVFGPDSLHLATWAEARRRLVKRASDSLMFTLAERAAGTTPSTPRVATGSVWAPHRPVARLASALTGNRQLESCLSLLP